MSDHGMVPAHIAHHHHRSGGRTKGGAPSCKPHGGLPGYHEMVSRYGVNLHGQWEAIKQTLYDSAAYAAAGSTQLTFFALPSGQGTGFGGGTKTLSDTNMQNASMLSAMQAFVVQNIEIQFWPTTPTVTAQMPAVFGAQVVAAIVNDVYIFRRSGNLQFTIGSKNYLTEGPLSKFPPKVNFAVEGALSDISTTGASMQSRVTYATVKGPVYHLSPVDLLLEANQFFNVTLNWPEGLQAITNPARIFVVLGGLLYRTAQ